jgi:hypothetical protein
MTSAPTATARGAVGPGAGSATPGAVGPGPGGPPTLTPVRRRVVGALAWVLLLVIGGVLLAVVTARPSPGDYLHPDGTGPQGARALVEVLRQHGIEVDVVGTTSEAVAASGAGTTVVVGNSDLLTSTAAERVLAETADADRLVLLDAAPSHLAALGLGLHVERPSGDAATGCTADWAEPGDRVSAVTWSLVPEQGTVPAGGTGCFPVPGERGPGDARPSAGFAAVDVPATSTHAPVTVIGYPDGATNRFVTEADHAGTLVRLLGGSPRLVWFHPTTLDLTENPAPESERVWPEWTATVLVLVGIAFLVFALARGRRLGRLVPEPLPVVVRAAETTESRAELYRSAGDRARAAYVLRRATAGRLAARLGLPASAPLAQLLPAAAEATGTPVGEVADLLTGPPPTDDTALVTLAQQLAHLEEKARRP